VKGKRFALIVPIAVVAMVAAACGNSEPSPSSTTGGAGSPTGSGSPTATETSEAPATTVGLVYDLGGRGDQSFNDAAAAGLEQAKSEFNLEVQELEPNQGGTNRAELLGLLASQGTQLVIGVGFLFAETVCAAALQYPDVHFGDVDGFIGGGDAPTCDGAQDLTAESNAASLLFAEEQGSYLVGAAAALKSTTGHIGFIGGVEIALIQKFEAGYVAGAKQINPDITIDIQYISQPPDFTGFNDPARGQEIATGMYDNGADVIYAAAGGSGGGVFQAAKDASADGTQHWAIGVDSDQYNLVADDLKPYVLTSMLKHVEVAVYETIKSEVEGNFEGGYHTFDLASGGVGYATSGGFVDDIQAQLDDLSQQIIDGTITVPTTPE
jgi:basic membrane protein A and related proteins